MSNKDILKTLNGLFGSYRAEWLKGKIFDLFAEPSYFNGLKDNRPCILEGGRGTGKTTVLRGLSYQGQYALHDEDISKFDAINFIGIYHRVNTNHVRAFIDGGLETRDWMKIFAHYFNLIICREVLIFLKWYNDRSNNKGKLDPNVCNLIAKSLHILNQNDNYEQLMEHVEIAMYEFQSMVNNIGGRTLPNLSMAGDPIKIITENLLSLPQFANKMFFILLDEYENYEDYQQQIINTLIKHSTENYSFKIGVRELGWRIKHTLNSSELLHDPADYVLINIERKLTNESEFLTFAKTVCQQRIMQLFPDKKNGNDYEIESALEQLTIEDEAILLGVEKTEYFKQVELLPQEVKNKILHLPKLYIYFIAYWSKWHDMTLMETINEFFSSESKWDTRYENYKYNMLFKIRKGRGKVGIQKYYSGWNTYVKLANGNIRYLMELVYRAYETHLVDNDDMSTKVSFKNQTIAAIEVGKKNLMELEGLWENGAQLTKLLLGFGRIFQVLASEEGNIAPEKNQFTIINSESISTECQNLIAAAVMNLALVRSPGNKLDDTSHTRDYLYTIHPIYSAFFVFSYRKKRKITVSQYDILGLISTPGKTIKTILNKSKVDLDAKKDLPTQMDMFEGFYND
jgi:hypothetical protein